MARSPGLNPSDFYFWGLMKAVVYTKGVGSEEDLRRRNFAAVNTIKVDVGLRERVRRGCTCRTKACVLANGGHF
jgi:hypothetical protein